MNKNKKAAEISKNTDITTSGKAQKLTMRQRARLHANAKRKAMRLQGKRSLNTWLDEKNIAFVRDYKESHQMQTMADAIGEIIDKARQQYISQDDSSEEAPVFLDSVATKIINEFSQHTGITDRSEATNQFIKMFSFLKKQFKIQDK